MIDLGERANKTLMKAKVEQEYHYKEWCIKLPAFHFDKEWDVRIIPPFNGAIIRFTISHNEKDVSVYFDAYSELGWICEEDGTTPTPYFEYYDGKDAHRYFLDEADQMMEDIREFLNN